MYMDYTFMEHMYMIANDYLNSNDLLFVYFQGSNFMHNALTPQ